MKTAEYKLLNGGTAVIEYDEQAPCRICGEPVLAASTSGTDVCPWCDIGICRYGCGAKLMPTERGAHDWKAHMEWHNASKDSEGASSIPSRLRENGPGPALQLP